MTKQISKIMNAGTVAFIARKDGVECPFLHLSNDSEEFRDFVCYAMMERDFRHAKELFIESQKLIQQPDLLGSVISEAVIAYSRPFKPGNDRSIRKLDHRNVFSESEDLAIHERLQFLRDKFFAHTDKNPYEDILLCVALNPDLSKKAVLDIYRGMPRSIGFDHATINRFIAVTNKALDWVDQILNQEHQKVLNFLRGLSIDELYGAAIDPAQFDPSIQKVCLDYPFA